MKLGDRFICMEWGHQAAERGLTLEQARTEFRTLLEITLGEPVAAPAKRETQK